MADEDTSADDALAAVMQRAAPTGGIDYRPSNAARKTTEAQTDADADAALAAVMRRMTQPTAAPPADEPPSESFLNRSFRSIVDLGKQVVRDVTPGAPHWPGSAPAPEAPPVVLHPLLAGTGRGARDVIDTGAEWLAKGASALGGSADVEGLKAANKQGRDAFTEGYGDSGTADVGRVVGQALATSPVLKGIQGVTTLGHMLPGAIGNAARYLTGLAPATGGVARTGQLVAQGAGAGATDAALTSSASDIPLGQQVALGAATGGVAGPVIGGLTKATDVLRGFAGGVRPEVARLAQEARQLGEAAGEKVNIPVAKLSENPYLKMMADTWSKAPFSGAYAADLRNQRGLQGVVAREMGSTANVFDNAMMKKTAQDLSDGYERALAKVPAITGGAPLANDLAKIGADATQDIVDKDALASVGRALQSVGAAFNNSTKSVNAAQFRSLVESQGTLQRYIDATNLPAAKNYIGKIKDALEARLRASAPPGVADEFHELDRMWRAMHTVAPLAAKSNLGDIPLAQLKQQVINQANKYDGPVSGVAFGGGGKLADVGRVGSQFFGHLPESGTPIRSASLNPLALGALAVPGMLNRPLQSWLRSPTVSRRVIETSLGADIPDISRKISSGLAGPAGLLGAIDYFRDRETPAQ